MTCIFCDIISGQAAASIVFLADLCVAFMDNHPVNPGHVLVVPRFHAASLVELDQASIGQMLQVAQRVDVAVRASGIRCEGVNLYLADGSAAGQEVMHVHLHVIPRFQGDGHHLRFSPAYFTRPSAAEIEENAVLIRQQIKEGS